MRVPAHCIECIIEDFQKFSFNKMLSMMHYAWAMHKIIEGVNFDHRAILQYSYATSIE